jgi:hypothetical protein
MTDLALSGKECMPVTSRPKKNRHRAGLTVPNSAHEFENTSIKGLRSRDQSIEFSETLAGKRTIQI